VRLTQCLNVVDRISEIRIIELPSFFVPDRILQLSLVISHNLSIFCQLELELAVFLQMCASQQIELSLQLIIISILIQ
jgi:hypothetical protein